MEPTEQQKQEIREKLHSLTKLFRGIPDNLILMTVINFLAIGISEAVNSEELTKKIADMLPIAVEHWKKVPKEYE